jgi:hypothetical protein
VLVQCHPAGGYFEFIIMSDTVALDCHWPVDLTADEWLDIQNNYSIASYLRAVDDAMSTGHGEARGITDGYLRISTIDEGFAIEFSRPQGGWSASSLRLLVRRPIAELLPRRDPLQRVGQPDLLLAGSRALRHPHMHGAMKNACPSAPR